MDFKRAEPNSTMCNAPYVHPRFDWILELCTAFPIKYSKTYIWASSWDFQQYGMCDQQSLKSACAYMQSDQSLC